MKKVKSKGKGNKPGNAAWQKLKSQEKKQRKAKVAKREAVFGSATRKARAAALAEVRKSKAAHKAKAYIPANGADADGQTPQLEKVTEVQPAPKDGPGFTVRLRSAAQMDRVRKAAKVAQLSANTWAVEVLDRAADLQLAG